MLATLEDHGEPVLPEVAIVFGSKIFRGSRARKYSEHDLEAFGSVNIPDLGHIRLRISINRSILRQQHELSDDFGVDFESDIAMVYLYPGINPELVFKIGSHSKGLVLAGFGAGNIPCCEANLSDNPCALESVIERLSKDKPVVITTQCVVGQAEFGMYEAGSLASNAGAIIANDMTPETAFVN